MSFAEKYEPYDFANRRHIGPSPEEMAEMLRVAGDHPGGNPPEDAA
jgi:glycine dehydrogenase